MSHLCIACGTQFPTIDAPPSRCPICEDERQFVPLDGQKWTMLDDLRRDHRNVFFEEGPRLWGIHTQPQFAIGQRALLIETGNGCFLWDCVSLVDDQTVGEIKQRGGLHAIAISHPHYYTSMVEWSRAFGGVPIFLHEDDRQWVQFPDPAIHYWSGESRKLVEGLTLIRVGAHFKGFQVLHWADGDGVLMTGDMPQVCPDHRFVSFMYSYPNFIPLDGPTVRGIVEKLAPYKFSRLYGAWPHFQVIGDAHEVLHRSAGRYLRAIGDVSPFPDSK